MSPSWVDKITSRELLWLIHPHKWEAPRSMAHFQKEWSYKSLQQSTFLFGEINHHHKKMKNSKFRPIKDLVMRLRCLVGPLCSYVCYFIVGAQKVTWIIIINIIMKTVLTRYNSFCLHNINTIDWRTCMRTGDPGPSRPRKEKGKAKAKADNLEGI